MSANIFELLDIERNERIEGDIALKRRINSRFNMLNVSLGDDYIDKMTDQTITGLKTFTQLPSVPNADNTTPADRVINKGFFDDKINILNTNLATKAVDSEVVKSIGGDQTISGVKTFNNSPIVPNIDLNDINSLKAINKKYCDDKIADLVNSAPETLNTLNELATALGNDQNFATTMTNSLASKAPLEAPTFTGTANFQNILITPDITLNGNSLTSKISGIDNSISGLNTSVGTLNNDVGTLNTSVSTLNTNVGTLNNDVATLNTNTTGQTYTNSKTTFAYDVEISSGKKLIVPAITLGGADLANTLSSYATTASLSSYATTASLSSYCDLGSSQTISGAKTFSNGITIPINKKLSGQGGIDISGNITTTGNISTTGTGTISSAGLITASNGITIPINKNLTGQGGIDISGNITTTGTITANNGITIPSGKKIALGGTSTSDGIYLPQVNNKTITPIELSYLSGVTSSIQTQLSGVPAYNSGIFSATPPGQPTFNFAVTNNTENAWYNNQTWAFYNTLNFGGSSSSYDTSYAGGNGSATNCNWTNAKCNFNRNTLCNWAGEANKLAVCKWNNNSICDWNWGSQCNFNTICYFKRNVDVVKTAMISSNQIGIDYNNDSQLSGVYHVTPTSNNSITLSLASLPTGGRFHKITFIIDNNSTYKTYISGISYGGQSKTLHFKDGSAPTLSPSRIIQSIYIYNDTLFLSKIDQY